MFLRRFLAKEPKSVKRDIEDTAKAKVKQTQKWWM